MTDDDKNTPAPPKDIEALLHQQAACLDDLFHHFMNISLRGNFSYSLMKNALQAQSQCQATVRTIKTWQKQQQTHKS